MLPSQFCELDPQEKAFVVACINIKTEAEEKAAKKARGRRKGK